MVEGEVCGKGYAIESRSKRARTLVAHAPLPQTMKSHEHVQSSTDFE